MRCTLLFLFITTIGTPAIGQTQPDRTRTKTIDYTEYDNLRNEIHTATDKATATKQLLDLTTTLFTAVDEEYFSTFNTAGNMCESVLLDFPAALRYYQTAIEAYEKHYPFFNRGYTEINEETPAYTYLALARVYNKLNLFDKSVQYLQRHSKMLEKGSPGVRQEYLRVLAES